jgi:hypothetical protein
MEAHYGPEANRQEDGMTETATTRTGLYCPTCSRVVYWLPWDVKGETPCELCVSPPAVLPALPSALQEVIATAKRGAPLAGEASDV